MNALFFPFLSYSHAALRKRLSGRNVLITGASYGIGECLAESLADTGARLLLVARTADKLAEVKARVEARGGQAEFYPCDLTNTVQLEELLAQLRQLPSGVDVVVNNAGKSIRRALFDELDRMHDFTRTMNLNYFAPVQLLLSLLPVLVARQGHVINISAVNVLLAPMPKWAAYQASKTAFDQWFRCAAPELRARGVDATTIYLPLVRTRMIEPTKEYANLPAMQPEDVARLICKAIIARKPMYAPWWMTPAQLASLLLRGPIEALMVRRLKHT